MTLQTVIIIPAYNHGRQISRVVAMALATGLPVIVVDDGSTDETAGELKKIPAIQVCTHAVNQGKGVALLTGFAAASARGFVQAITLDADGQHIPEDCAQLLAAVPLEGRCIVLGRRKNMDQLGHVPWTSRFGRGFSNFWVWTCGGPWVSDSQSGFRLYPLPEVLRLPVVARRYQYEVEVLVRAKRVGLNICEADVQVVYQAPGVRVSHFRPWTDFLRNSRTFATLFFARLLGRL